MKELSIEQKAKRYDEAIERAMELATDLPNGRNDRLYHVWDLESIFPELKESEDERIRQFLIHEVTETSNKIMSYRNMNKEAVLAWLEKQAEQKPIVIIPKFKVGDKIWHKNYKGECMHHIIRIENNNYIGDDNTSISISTADKEYELVEKQGEQKCNEEYNITGIKSKNAEGKLGEMIMNLKSVNEVLEQKPKQEWSEEDEETLKDIITSMTNLKDSATSDALRDIYNSKIDWLKSLKDKVHLQPKQEWSEEDERMWSQVINEIKAIKSNSSTVLEKNIAQDKIDFLKNLKDRYTWKPSDEQMGVIEAVINNRSFQRRHLDSLYADLKKLRKE